MIQMGKINIGIIGVGNCFAGLVQGIEYYRKHPSRKVHGLMHERIENYTMFDFNFTCAFDVGKNKIGKRLDQAIYEEPNCVNWIPKVPKIKAKVRECPVLDGIGVYVEKMVNPVRQRKKDEELKKDIIKEVKDTGTEMLVNYLPVGSEKAVRFWADVALQSEVGIVNCMPVFIASDEKWEKEFRAKGLPMVGDDVKGQVGATILHRVITKMCDDRGTDIRKTYQLNVGGNTDFANMLERDRLITKKISKTEAVQSQLLKRLREEKIHVGPSDFLPFLGNTKICYINVDATMFADRPFEIECKLTVDDKSNSAGVVIDAVRCLKLGLERRIGGTLTSPSAYLMKHPPVQYSDWQARELMEEFIAGKIER